MDDGSYDWWTIFDNEDYNRDGYVDERELVNAMVRGGYDEEMMTWGYEMYWKHQSGNGLSFDDYMAVVDEWGQSMGDMAWDGSEMAVEGHGYSGSEGPRMEIHMEERPDGSNSMTIIMESAQKLAVSATALAAAALFSY